MKKKKIIARIGVIVACVFLVGSLAVPAFADDTQARATATVPLSSATEWFNAYIGENANNHAYSLLYDWYLGSGNLDFYDQPWLVSGTATVNNSGSAGNQLFIDISTTAEETTYTKAQFAIGALSVAIYQGGDNPTNTALFSGGYMEYEQYYNSTDGLMITLRYYPNQTQLPQLTFRFRDDTTIEGLQMYLEAVGLEGTSFTPTQLQRIEYAFTIPEYTTPYFLPTIVELINFHPYQTLYYDNAVYSPKMFYYGINQAYSDGYDDGYRYGFAAGYDEGYDDGETNALGTDAYQAGYNKALEEIESGDFGRNFLGSIFSAPFDMLERFTLIEWTTQGGTTISVSLGTVISAGIGIALFVWFLKTFAGG